MKEKRMIEMDVLRGVAVLLMALGHSLIVYPIDVNKVTWCYALRVFIYSFHMPLFFFLAGYVYKCEKYIVYIKKKIFRVLIPYFFFSFVSVLARIYGGVAVNSSITWTDGFFSIVTFQEEWFLPSIFLMYTSAPLFYRFFNTNVKKTILIIVLAIISLFCTLPSFFQISNTIYFYPYFIFGTICKNSRRLEMLFNKTNSRICFSLLSLSIYIWSTCSPIGNSILKKYICAFTMILFTFIVTKNIKINDQNSIVKAFCALSAYSLQIYLLNGYPLTIIRYIMCVVMKVTNPLIIVPVLCLGILLFALIVCKIVEKIPLLATLFGLKCRNSKWRQE